MHNENVKVPHADTGRMRTDTTVYICNRKHYILCYISCVTAYQNDKKIMHICRFFFFFFALCTAQEFHRDKRGDNILRKIPATWQK